MVKVKRLSLALTNLINEFEKRLVFAKRRRRIDSFLIAVDGAPTKRYSKRGLGFDKIRLISKRFTTFVCSLREVIMDKTISNDAN